MPVYCNIDSNPWYKDYQDLIGALIGVAIPIIVTLLYNKLEEKSKKIESIITLLYLINKELNSIFNYQINIDEQIRHLNNLKYNEEDLKSKYVFKEIPILIDDYKSVLNNNFYVTESNFINSQLILSKNDAEGFEYNSKLLSSQIRRLYERNNDLVNISITKESLVNPDHIRQQFDSGVDSIVILLNNIKDKSKDHYNDILTLGSALNEYLAFSRKFFSIFRWKIKFDPKNKNCKNNIYFKKVFNSKESFDIMYEYFNKKGNEELKTKDLKISR